MAVETAAAEPAKSKPRGGENRAGNVTGRPPRPLADTLARIVAGMPGRAAIDGRVTRLLRYVPRDATFAQVGGETGRAASLVSWPGCGSSRPRSIPVRLTSDDSFVITRLRSERGSVASHIVYGLAGSLRSIAGKAQTKREDRP